MKIVVGVLTWNARATGRLGLLERTMKSLAVAFPSALCLLYENGGVDVQPRHGFLEVRSAESHRPGAGRNRLLQAIQTFPLCHQGADLIVLSDDDMEWRSDAEARLRSFWEGGPSDVAVLGGLLEPEWAWNRPLDVVSFGGQRALVRESVPACAWSFPYEVRGRLFPLDDVPSGEDVLACIRARGNGFRVAAMDLAIHLGRGYSTTGNNPPVGTPVDPETWR